MITLLLSSTGFFGFLSLFLVGALGSLLCMRRDALANYVGNSFAALGSLGALVFSFVALTSGRAPTFTLPAALPWLNFSIHIDPLSAFFMMVISLISVFCSIYALGYVRHFYGTYNIGSLGFFFNVFIASTLLVASAHNALLFLIVWELMALSSFFLVIYEHKQKENVEAGYLYFIMTHTGTAFILMSFLLLFRATGSFDFDTIRASGAMISPLMASLIFVSALIGFGIKTGIIPLHIWLPSAHPAAPSHVSAVMSGVMIKTGIYMLVRIGFDLLPHTQLWWGFLVITLGAVSSIFGVLYALAEHDIKRLLAYHSIENIGIIFLGLGSALVFAALNQPTLALLGLVAALFHTLNHAIFKALLFLAGGAAVGQVHTRNIERYGGLIRFMPVTALCFLIGAMAISGLPPFNGFFSEWLTFQALFVGAALSLPTKMLFVVAIAALAYTGGLAAACFVKAFGAIFLARPRSEAVSHAVEATFPMQFAMAMLASLTVIVGFCAGKISLMLAGVATSMQALSGAALPGHFILAEVSVREGFATLSMPAVLAVLLMALGAIGLLTAILSRKQCVTTGPTWDCGTALTPRMEITATGFSHSIIVVLRSVLRPTRQSAVEYHDAALRYFPKSRSVHFATPDVFLALYRPISRGMTRLSADVRRIQNGNVNAYILYIALTLLILLFILAW